MFITSKKAATEAEAREILNSALACQKPFGIPTVTLIQTNLPDHLPESGKTGDIAYGEKGRLLSGILWSACFTHLPYDAATLAFKTSTQSTIFPDLIKAEGERLALHAYSSVVTRDGFEKRAHLYPPDRYVQPLLNCVIAPALDKTGEGFLAAIFENPISDMPKLPGTSSQWAFMDLIHEYGHGTGAHEPQTEMIAAIVSRKAFEETSFLATRADIRAIWAILEHYGAELPEHLQNYGYAMVEALDQVAVLDQKDIDLMSEEDIIALRYKQFSNDFEAAKNVSAKFADQSLPFPKSASFKQAGERMQKMVEANLFEGRERKIAERFALAAHRLGTGIPAYSTETRTQEADKNQSVSVLSPAAYRS